MDIYETLNYICKKAIPKVQYDWNDWNLNQEDIIFQVAGWSNKIADYVEDYFEIGLNAILEVIQNSNFSPEESVYARQFVVAIANGTINYHSDIATNKAADAYKLYIKNHIFRESVIEYAQHLYKLIPNLIAYSFFNLDFKTLKDVCNNCIPRCTKGTKLHKQLMEKLHDEFTYNHSFYDLISNNNVLQYWEMAIYINQAIPELDFFQVKDGMTIATVMHELDDIKSLIPLEKEFDKGILWTAVEELPRVLEFNYTYPNGSNGDIVKYILEEYGETFQIAPNVWSGKIDKEYLDLFEMLAPTAYKITSDVRFLAIYEHHIPSILYNTRMRLFSSKVAVRANFEGIKQKINKHKLEQRKKRDQVYADLILADKTSPKWKSEAQLFSLVSSQYTDAVYQYRAEWLGMQSLDIYIPSLAIGIEYQGRQHYKPIEHFGGEKHFLHQQENDRKKRALCKENGIKLIEWPYTDEITEENLKKYLAEADN